MGPNGETNGNMLSNLKQEYYGLKSFMIRLRFKTTRHNKMFKKWS